MWQDILEVAMETKLQLVNFLQMEQQVYLSTEDSLSTLGAREATAVMVVWRELPEADISAET